MSAILDLLYREYCRARLAEMRKQLLLSVTNDETPAATCDASDLAGLDDRGQGFGEDTATRKPQPSGIGIAPVDDVLGIVAPLEHHG
jgi:hypothetical protein